jgi:hypothetical protein
VQANATKFTAKCRNALVAGSEKQTKAEREGQEKAAAKKEKAAAKKEK